MPGYIFDIIQREIIASGITTSGICLLLVMTKRWHGKHSMDTTDGVQKFHTLPTPRVGGVAIFFGLVVAWLLMPGSAVRLLGPMLIAGLPAFTAGLTEDITKKVGVKERLIATMLSGLLAWRITGYSINHVDIAAIDPLLAILPVSVLFTVFAVSGLANAINILDGFNGLASGTAMLCFSAIGLIAWQVGDLQLAELCLVLIVVVGGFLLMNYPLGKIFMGDGGAYLVGFLLAWVAVMLPMRNPGVSAWASLLICGYPINETLFSMSRRFLNKNNPGAPDIHHLHSLIKLKIIRPHFGQLSPHMRNSLVSPFCWIYALLLAGCGVLLQGSSALLMAAWVASFMLYILIYWYLTCMSVQPTDESCSDSPELAQKFVRSES